MASISNLPNGGKVIQFIGGDGRRRSIRLGKVAKRQAEAVRTRIENLANYSFHGIPLDQDTAHWLSVISDDLRDRLAKVGLAESRQQTTLSAFLDDYIAKHRGTVKTSTITTWKQCRRLLLEYFNPQTPLREITEGQTVEWRAYLIGGRLRRLSDATVRRRCSCARTMFRQAVRLGLIDSNPFESAGIPTGSPRSKQKFYVADDLANRIMDRLPNSQWRLLFALGRWGGLRVISEPKALRWPDIDWERRRIRIPAPKTEHLTGHSERWIPMFPELVQPLQDRFDEAEPGDEQILPMLQKMTSAATRKPLIKAIIAAGGKQWDKLWTSLRATRDTELRGRFPSHVVQAWIGHDDRVAERHYLQVTDDHFREALADVQRAADCGAATDRKASKAVEAANQPTGIKPQHFSSLREKTVPSEMQGTVSDGRYWT